MGKNSAAKITRRGFAGMCLGAAAFGSTGSDSRGQIDGTHANNSPTRASTVDQNPIRRRGTGLRALDVARASAGLTLFAPTGDRMVYLIDLHGAVVHTWTMPYPPGLYGYLTEKGTLFYNGQIPNATFSGNSPFKGGASLEADWNGKVLWEVRQPDHHHDGRLLKNGNVLLLCATELSDEAARKIQGGRPGTEANGKIWADYLVEVTKDGRKVWEWRAWGAPRSCQRRYHRDTGQSLRVDPRECDHRACKRGPVGEFPKHLNDHPDSSRQTGEIVWKLAAPPLAGQHAPTPLANGNILIFDNGPHRLDHSFPYSRVIEVNPVTNEIVWKYQEENLYNFYSPRISNAQRLPNGNTLVNEGFFGRLLEVTPEGDVVWEYVNPHFGPASETAKAQSNAVFRVYRYTERRN